MSSKNKNKSKSVKQEQKHGVEEKMGGRDAMANYSQVSTPSTMIGPVISPSIHTPTAFSRPSMTGIPAIHPGIYGSLLPASSNPSSYLPAPPSVSVNAS